MANNNKKLPKQTRVKKNQKAYGKKVVVKSYRIHRGIILILILSLLINFFALYHFITFNHNKIKVVTKEIIKTDDNFVFLGDSITYQYDLKKYFGNNLHLVNSGIDGNTPEDILSNMEERVYRYNPTKVFLLIGTNDLSHKSNAEIFESIKKIIEGINKNRPNCMIYLESIYPINNTNDKKIIHEIVGNRKNKDIKEINSKLSEYAKKNKKVTYINIHNQLMDEDGNFKIEYTREGLHLSEEGYKKVTTILKKYLKEN